MDCNNLIGRLMIFCYYDICDYEDYAEVITEPNKHTPVAEGLQEAGYTILSSETTLVPDSYIDLDADKLVKFNKMIERKY